jgi:hypothetical protein
MVDEMVYSLVRQRVVLLEKLLVDSLAYQLDYGMVVLKAF